MTGKCKTRGEGALGSWFVVALRLELGSRPW